MSPPIPPSASSIDKKFWWKPAISGTETFLGEKPFLGAFLVALFLYIPIVLLFKSYFQWDDDYYSVLVLKGIGLNAAPSEWNILQNILLCLALKNLYIQSPAIQWYSCLFVLTHFLSVWALLTAFNLGINRFLKTALFILGSAVLEVRFHIQMEWTVVAATAAVGAFLLLAALWKKTDSNFLRPALSLIFALIMLSVLIRPYSLLLIGLASIPAATYLLWKSKMTDCRWTLLKFLAITAVLSLAIVAFDHYEYSQNPAWRDYKAITDQYVQLSQFRKPDYTETTKPVFDSIGWTLNDRNLFCYNYFMDPDIYSVEKLQKLNDYFPRFGFNKKASQDSFGAMFASPGFLAALFFFLSILPFLAGKNFWFMVVDAVWTLMVLCFFQWYLKMPERIFIPCLYLLNNLALFFALSHNSNSTEISARRAPAFKWGIALQSLCFLFTLYLLLMHYSVDRYWIYQESKLKTAMQTLNPQDDQVFVTWGSAFPYNKIGAFDNDEFLRHFHIISLDWFQRSPTTAAMMDHYGLKNVLKDMVNNPKVFLICDPYEWNLYRIYMKEKYNKDVNGKIDYQSDQFTVLSVHSS